jgi:ABC-type nitrate/sulfonate/bicarbonate transport system substrate-binding protein
MAGCALVIIFLFLPIGSLSAQTLKTVRMMTPTIGVNVLVYEAASRFGFYRQEGLAIELIRAPLGTSIQAVLGGSADYVRHGSAVGAILGGVPFKALAVDTDRSPHYIIGKRDLANIQDLVGRTLAIDDLAGSAYWATRETLSKNGINPDKVNFRRMGGPELRLQALLAGVVDAAPLNFVLSGRARENNNFKVLAYTGDFVSDVQLMVAAPTDKIKRLPEEVYKFIKATVKARKFQFENEPEAYKFYLELERLSDTKFAKEGWEARLKGSSPAARLAMLSNAGMNESIVTWKEQMALAGRPLKIEGRAEDVYDFAFAKRAHDELKAEGWDAKKYQYSPKK